MPNARVEIESVDTGQRLNTTSDANGNYQFANVPSGRYRVLVTGTGSSTGTPGQEIVVEASRGTVINIRMSTGTGTDIVPTTETVDVERKPASISDFFNTRYIQYLPLSNFVNRNGQAFGAYNLAALSEASNGSLLGWPGGPAIGGQRPNTNNYHVNGIDNNNLLQGGGPAVYVSNEATTEFILLQNQPQPLFGHTGGGQMNSILRSGTNAAHGSIYDYVQNRNLNAVDRILAGRGFGDGLRYDQNRMGGNLGIPVIPNKMFFFGSFEYIPLGFERPTATLQLTPTAGGLNTLARVPGVSASNLGILQNATSGTVNEASAFTTVLGVPVGLGYVNNTFRGWQNQIAATGGIDWTLSDKDQLRARYSHNDIDANWSGFGLSAYQTPRFMRAFVASLAHTHTFGNAVTNELRFGYTRNNSEQYGLSNQPNIFIGQGFNLGLGPQFMPTGVVNTYHLADGVSFNFKGHDIRAGFDGRRFLGSRSNFSQFAGNYGYSTLERFLLDVSPDVTSERAFGNSSYDLGQWNWFGFVHDTWNARPGVTLDFGLRYQYSNIPTGLRSQGMNAGAGVGDFAFNEPGTQLKNFAPYFGFAWSPPFGKNTVLRGGWGMYYDAMNMSPIMYGFAPSQTRLVQGNLLTNQINFLGSGGLQNPAAFGDNSNPTNAQLRAATTAYVPNQQMPYSMQWNVALQQSIWRGAVLEVKYLSNRGVHLPVFGQLNSQGITETRSLPVYDARPTQAQLNALPFTLGQLLQPQSNAFTQAGFTNPMNTVTYDGNSWYNAAVVRLNHSFKGGFQMTANYTWSRFEDDSTGTPLDIGMTTRQRTWSMFDRRHSANVTAMFEVAPLFRNSWSVVRNVFADFNVSGTYSYGTGSTLIPVTGLNTAFSNNPYGTRAILTNASGSDASLSGLTPLTNSQGGTVAYMIADPSARYSAGAPGAFGGNSRGGIMLPDIHNFDIAAVKKFHFRERASIDVRGEAYNIFNRQQVSTSSLHSIGWPALAAPNAFAVPGTVNINDINRLGLVLPSNSRMLQLAVRVTF